MFVTVAVVSALSGGLVVASNAFAQTNGQTSPSLAQEIANKFHLTQSDVQAVFAQHQQERQTKMESNYETYLGNLVTSGKITEEQQQLLLTKHKELTSQMQSNTKNFKNMTLKERSAQMQTTQKNLESWAKQNNINLKYLRPFGSGMGRFGKMGEHNKS